MAMLGMNGKKRHMSPYRADTIKVSLIMYSISNKKWTTPRTKSVPIGFTTEEYKQCCTVNKIHHTFNHTT